MMAAVILGYLSAVFGVLGLGGIDPLFLLLFIGVGVGAFGSANNQRWGYYLLAICSLLLALFWLVVLAYALNNGVVSILRAMNRTVFPTALAAAALHRHSREYQKVWFE